MFFLFGKVWASFHFNLFFFISQDYLSHIINLNNKKLKLIMFKSFASLCLLAASASAIQLETAVSGVKLVAPATPAPLNG